MSEEKKQDPPGLIFIKPSEKKTVTAADLKWARENWLFHNINERLICFYKFPDGSTPEDGKGFSFVIIQDPNTPAEREPLFWGEALFDGVRHMHMGDEEHENEGYLYHPVMENVIAAMQYLKELQTKYCRDFYE